MKKFTLNFERRVSIRIWLTNPIRLIVPLGSIKTTPLKRTTSKVTLLETKIRKKMSLMQYRCVFGTLNLCICLSQRSTGKSRLLSIHQESMRFLQARKIPSNDRVNAYACILKDVHNLTDSRLSSKTSFRLSYKTSL